MDLLRGVAVLLIVVNHATVNLDDAGLAVPTALQLFNDMFAPFRIPLLTFLSGLLLAGSLRKGARPYFEGKISNIGWPYLVWLVPHALTKDAPDPVLVLLGETQLWFLLFLGFYYVLAFVLQKVPPPLVIIGASILSLVAPGGEKYGERLWFLFAFFMAGHWVAGHPVVWRRIADGRWTLVCALVVLAVYLGPSDTFAYGPRATIPSVAGVVVICHVARRIASARGTGPVRAAGRDSLVVYVSHAIGMQVVGAVAVLLGWTSAPLLFVAFLVVGVALPVALIALKRRWRPAEYLFTLRPRVSRPRAALTVSGGR